MENPNIFIPQNGCSEGIGDNKGDKLGNVTYCMEDQYPDKGDFDLNDIVVEITPEKIISNSSDKDKVNIECKIRAVGAAKIIAGYVEINGKDTLLFDNAHKGMEQPNGTFINTDKSIDPVEPKTIRVENIECNKDFKLDDMKFFIKAGGDAIYAADQGGINTEKQTIGGVRLLTKDFKYPLEKKSISDAYKEDGHKIVDWIKSCTEKVKDWYNYPTEVNCYK